VREHDCSLRSLDHGALRHSRILCGSCAHDHFRRADA